MMEATAAAMAVVVMVAALGVAWAVGAEVVVMDMEEVAMEGLEGAAVVRAAVRGEAVTEAERVAVVRAVELEVGMGALAGMEVEKVVVVMAVALAAVRVVEAKVEGTVGEKEVEAMVAVAWEEAETAAARTTHADAECRRRLRPRCRGRHHLALVCKSPDPGTCLRAQSTAQLSQMGRWNCLSTAPQ